MRRYVIDNLLLGASIGLIALAIRELTGGATRYYQLLAVVLAGVALFGIQLVLARYRARQADESEDGADLEQNPRRMRRHRRDPFSRELTHDWTGLDAYPAAPPSADDLVSPPAPEPSDKGQN